MFTKKIIFKLRLKKNEKVNFLLLLIASIFVACEPQQTEEPSFVNEDVYGAWVCENGGHIISPDITRDLIYI